MGTHALIRACIRLRFWLLTAVVLNGFVAFPAAADFPAERTYRFTLYEGGTSPQSYTNLQDLCDAATAYFGEIFKPDPVTLEAVHPSRCDMIVHRDPDRYGPYRWSSRNNLVKLECPANSHRRDTVADEYQCACDNAFAQAANSCVPAEMSEAPSCPAGAFIGNPILPATAEKYLRETDLIERGPAPLEFARIYRSRSYDQDPSALGSAWRHDHSWRLRDMQITPTTVLATIRSPEGNARDFRSVGRGPWTAVDHGDTLTALPDGTRSYRRSDDDTTRVFETTTGQPISETARNGWVTRYSYDGQHKLNRITNAFGRSLSMTYRPEGQIASVTSSGGQSVAYGYDALGRLSSVTFADGKSKSFVYENAAFPLALTGVVDESGARFATYTYDDRGRAIGTEHAGGARRYAVSYPDANSASVTDPLGTARVYQYSTAGGKSAVSGSSLVNADGAPDAQRRTLDSNGLVSRSRGAGASPGSVFRPGPLRASEPTTPTVA